MSLSAPVSPPVRPPLLRPAEGRVLGGVAAGLAVHLGWPVRAIRVGLVIAAVAGSGAGLALYLWLWALVPVEAPEDCPRGPGDGVEPASAAPLPPSLSPTPSASPVSPALAPAAPAAVSTTGPAAAPGPPVVLPVRPEARPGALPGPAGAPPVPRAAGRRGPVLQLSDVALGLLLLAAAGIGISLRGGWGPPPVLTLAAVAVLAGGVLVYHQLDEVEHSRWRLGPGAGGRGVTLRLICGVTLVAVGVLLGVFQNTSLVDVSQVLLGVLAVLTGVGLVLAPWGVRLWQDLDAERAARVRDATRADFAAHLHDSVLQTLALIQRHSQDPAQVARLARSQERELRDWLYKPPAPAQATLAGEVARAAAQLEDRHGVAIEVVVVGDRPADARGSGLVAALGEAMLNAVRHAGAPVQVYVEITPDGVEAFVRDRGPGFDLDGVPADRLGVRESIIGRMARHGGRAEVRAGGGRDGGGHGTEVRLYLPAEPAAPPAHPAPDPPAGGEAGDDPAVSLVKGTGERR